MQNIKVQLNKVVKLFNRGEKQKAFEKINLLVTENNKNINCLLLHAKICINLNEIDKGNSKWLIISDGTIFENQIEKNKPLKLGYDKWTNNIYSNKEFIINKIHEFSNNKTYLNSRNKKINKILVDKIKLIENLDFWRFFARDPDPGIRSRTIKSIAR